MLYRRYKRRKKNKLIKNIEQLEDISKSLETEINQLKILFQEINKDKENIKLNVKTIFSKIRNTINEREDELLLEVDKQFSNLFFNENIINKIIIFYFQ